MSGTIPWERVRRAGSKLTTPLHPDDYLRLLNPLWSERELRDSELRFQTISLRMLLKPKIESSMTFR